MAAAVILASVPPLAADPPDRLAEALSAVSFDRSDLGCRPKTWWSRFGHFAGTQRIPFYFPDLFAEPLRTYEASRVMAGAMEHYLAPSYRAANEDGAFKTAYFLGFTHLSAAHRGYRAGVVDLPADLVEPLTGAMEELYRAGGREAGADLQARVRAEADALPRTLHRPLARFLWRLARAHRWAEEAFEAVPAADQAWIAAEQTAHEIKYAPALRRASAEADLVLLDQHGPADPAGGRDGPPTTLNGRGQRGSRGRPHPLADAPGPGADRRHRVGRAWFARTASP